MLFGKAALFRLVHPAKAKSLIIDTGPSEVRLLRLVHPSNACWKIDVTLLGKVIPVRLVQFLKAPWPILVTFLPLIELGMAILPPAPLYPVIVT